MKSRKRYFALVFLAPVTILALFLVFGQRHEGEAPAEANVSAVPAEAPDEVPAPRAESSKATQTPPSDRQEVTSDELHPSAAADRDEDSEDNTAVPAVTIADPAAALDEADAKPFAELIEGEAIEIPRKAIDALLEAQPGDRVTLPLPEPVEGVVTMNHVHEDGTVAFSTNLAGFQEAVAYVSKSASGEIGGGILSQRSGSAFEFTGGKNEAKVLMHRVSPTEIVCSRVRNDRMLGGIERIPRDGAPEPAGNPVEMIPILQSRPGSSNVLYLDFDGETVVGTRWNSYVSGAPIVASAYAFQDRIPRIWEIMAEDFAPWNVNVTTDRAVYNAAASSNRMMVIFTATDDWYPNDAGGVAYLNSWGVTDEYCCWVWNSGEKTAGETGSHEAGHTFNLAHDGRTTPDEEYFYGHTHSSGVRWAPIMGAGFDDEVVQFSRGEYPAADNSQDDLAIISGKIPYVPDDHGNTNGASTLIPNTLSGSFSQGGLISNSSDTDTFRFVTNASGAFQLTVTPDSADTNLDTHLEIFNSAGALVATAAPQGLPLSATISVPNLAAGTYYFAVSGSGLGDTTTGYSNYGCTGPYTLTCTYPYILIPSVPTGVSASDGTFTTHVQVTWNVTPGGTAYRVYRNTSNTTSGATLVGDVTDTSFQDLTAEYGTTYWYWVRAYNFSAQSAYSIPNTGWRRPPTPESPTGMTATDGTSTDNVFINWNAMPFAAGYKVYRNTANSFVGSTEIANVPTNSHTDTTAVHNVTYFYFVVAYNSADDESPASMSDSGFRRLPLPSVPNGVSATDGSSTAYVRVTWNLTNFAYSFEIWRNSVNSSAGATMIGATGGSTYQFDDTTSVPGEINYYFVRAVNPEGSSNFSSGNAGYKLIPPPATPTGVTASDGTTPLHTEINWTAVQFAAAYYVFRNTNDSSAGSKSLGSVSGTTFFDTTGVAGVVYYYFVQAVNSDGISAFSASNTGYRQAAPPFATPQITASQGTYENVIRVEWAESADTVTYAIYRNSVNSPSGAIFLGRQANHLFFDATAQPGRTYYYFVKGENSVGVSPYSAGAVGFAGTSDPVDDEYENNDIFENATAITSTESEWLSKEDGPGVLRDADWYRVKLDPTSPRIEAILAYEPTSHAVALNLYDDTGTMLVAGETGDYCETLAHEGAPGETYYLSVTSSGYDGTSYDLIWKSLDPGEHGVVVDHEIGTAPTSQVGDGVFNSTAAGQTITSSNTSSATRRAYVTIRNESATPREFVTTGTGGSRFFSVTYRQLKAGTWENVTADVLRGDARTQLVPYGASDFTVSVTPGAIKKTKTANVYVTMTTTMEGDPGIVDTNRFNVTKKGKKKKKKKSKRKKK